jgi:tRNA(Arg) A34 adenosine deaminase TadA
MVSDRTNAPAPSSTLRITELSGTDFRWIARAIQQANKSRMRVRVGALVVVASRATPGHNKYRNPPRLSYLEASSHAEINALKRATKGGTGGTIYVARLGAKGRLLPSFPCRRCMPKIHEAGVKRIVWWDGSRWVATKTSSLFVG